MNFFSAATPVPSSSKQTTTEKPQSKRGEKKLDVIWKKLLTEKYIPQAQDIKERYVQESKMKKKTNKLFFKNKLKSIFLF